MEQATSEDSVRKKIQAELLAETKKRNYNRELWTDEFIEETAKKYYDHFYKLYELDKSHHTKMENIPKK